MRELAVQKMVRELRPFVPPTYWTVWWGSLINRAGGFVVPLLTLYLTNSRGMSASEAGAVVSYFGLGLIAAALLGGKLADTIGRKRTMMLALLGGSGITLAVGFAHSTTTISILVFAMAFINELYRPAVAAFVADVVPTQSRLAAYSFLYWGTNIGFAIASVLGGVIADVEFLALFVLDAATTAFYGVVVWLRLTESKPVRAADHSPRLDAAQSPLRDPTFLLFVAVHLVLAVVPYQSVVTLALELKHQGYSATTYGLVVGLNGVLVIGLQPWATKLAPRFNPLRLLAGCAMFYGFGMALHGFAPLLVIHLLAVTLWTLAEVMESPTRATVVAALASTHGRGRYQGMMGMTWGFGAFVGPRLGTWGWQRFGSHIMWAGCFVIGTVAALLLLWLTPRVSARLENARA